LLTWKVKNDEKNAVMTMITTAPHAAAFLLIIKNIPP